MLFPIIQSSFNYSTTIFVQFCRFQNIHFDNKSIVYGYLKRYTSLVLKTKKLFCKWASGLEPTIIAFWIRLGRVVSLWKWPKQDHLARLKLWLGLVDHEISFPGKWDVMVVFGRNRVRANRTICDYVLNELHHVPFDVMVLLA